MDSPLSGGQAFSEDMRPRCSATTSHGSEGVRMDARSVWFRENGEGRPKEQLLIETMFCVYYLSKRSAVRETRALHLQPPFLNTFSLSVPSCGSLWLTDFTGCRLAHVLDDLAKSYGRRPVCAGEHERRPHGRRWSVSGAAKAAVKG